RGRLTEAGTEEDAVSGIGEGRLSDAALPDRDLGSPRRDGGIIRQRLSLRLICLWLMMRLWRRD
ncbi:MAG TPA: hypothetical protein VGR15_02005, partial [Bacteroidota bacterium]|nr:hypothetical protein [Bacteroidota bacterium]